MNSIFLVKGYFLPEMRNESVFLNPNFASELGCLIFWNLNCLFEWLFFLKNVKTNRIAKSKVKNAFQTLDQAVSFHLIPILHCVNSSQGLIYFYLAMTKQLTKAVLIFFLLVRIIDQNFTISWWSIQFSV